MISDRNLVNIGMYMRVVWGIDNFKVIKLERCFKWRPLKKIFGEGPDQYLFHLKTECQFLEGTHSVSPTSLAMPLPTPQFQVWIWGLELTNWNTISMVPVLIWSTWLKLDPSKSSLRHFYRCCQKSTLFLSGLLEPRESVNLEFPVEKLWNFHPDNHGALKAVIMRAITSFSPWIESFLKQWPSLDFTVRQANKFPILLY